MICITATPEKFGRKYLSGKWQPLINEAGNKGYEVEPGGLGECVKFPENEIDISLDEFFALGADGYTVENWPCFLSLDSAKYNDTVPDGIPDRIITDDEGNETVKTWAEWGSSEHVDLTDGTKGIPLVYNHTACTNVECSVLSDLAGYTLLDTASYQALLPVGDGL